LDSSIVIKNYNTKGIDFGVKKFKSTNDSLRQYPNLTPGTTSTGINSNSYTLTQALNTNTL